MSEIRKEKVVILVHRGDCYSELLAFPASLAKL